MPTVRLNGARHLTSEKTSSLTPRKNFRADIQGLRALAVGLVVANHLWPARLSGGYVGVDVFFVVSGFLITSHLTKELRETGRIRLAGFYARRVRRLLPAAFLVLVASTAATLVILPFSRWAATAREVVASVFYVENWALAAKSVDYSASLQSATVAQHFWSLAVEEQFYLVWPLLLLGLFAASVALKLASRRVMAGGVVLLGALSLATSVLMTEYAHNQAYFVTPVRAWEFGAGALAVFALERHRVPRRLAAWLSASGFALILVAALTFDESTQFPGWVALVPVAGTAAVIVAGAAGTPKGVRAVEWAPVQFLGNISYSLYLWHWPLIVVAPFVLGRQLGTVDKLSILAVSLVLAALTKTWVEDRGQAWDMLRRSNRRTFAAMAAAMALVAAVSMAQTAAVGWKEADALKIAQAEEHSPCYGPRALDSPGTCSHPFGVPASATMTKANQYWNAPGECGSPRDDLKAGGTKTHLVCDFSQGRKGAKTVWLVGDSHAQHWQGAVFAVAKARHWIVKTALLGGCPVAAVRFSGYEGQSDPGTLDRCRTWSASVISAVSGDHPSAVFTSTFARREDVDDGSGRPKADQFIAGLRSTWHQWARAGADVYVLADPPFNADVRSVDCLSLHSDQPDQCAVARRTAQPPDLLSTAATGAKDGKVRLVDLSQYFCDPGRCYAAVGGVAVYFDANHLNEEFSRLLGPMLERRLAG